MRQCVLLLSVVWLLVSGMSTHAASSGDIASDIWQLPSTARSSRWLVIHYRAAAHLDGIYHIEVLERAIGAPEWQVKHLAPHMAISAAALRASIVKPLKRGGVYPETFNFAYAAWKAQQAQGKSLVCESDVLTCLK
jgi:hypothetical protein